MGLFSSIKKLGRAVDPTSKTSALGGVARAGIGFLPGGGAILAAADMTAKVTSDIKRAAPTDRGAPVAPLLNAPPYAPDLSVVNAPPPPSALSGKASLGDFLKRNRTGLVIAAAVLVIAGIGAAVLRRRK